jgi:tripartite-type tricarboxylate transporter receptor subunit TctC
MKFWSLLGAVFAACGFVIGLHTTASAQTYPDRSVRMIVAYPPGGTLDALSRIIAQKLSEAWRQSVQVENRPGAGGNIGAVAAAHAPPDGYTLHFGAQSLAVNVTISPYAGFDPVRDFEPVILVATAQDVLLVPPGSPLKSVGELIAYAKIHPGELNYASLGIGSSGHLATTMFADLAGIHLQHVPYTTLSQASTDLIAGRISLWIATMGGHLGNITAGKVRALAVSGPVRAAQLPAVPTFKELGIGFTDETSWFGIFTPKGTPKPIIDKINSDVARILAMPDVKEKGTILGLRVFGGSPDGLAIMLRSEITKWAAIAKMESLVDK